MGLVFVVVLLITVGSISAEEPPGGLVVQPINTVNSVDNGLANTDLITAFVMFRHGDRTPDSEELEMYPSEQTFFPFGLKALTNKGKQRSYLVGLYIRKRYKDFISGLYLPEEITVRTTDYARTKMTALAALAALYRPLPAQKWNPSLDWQPVPYDTVYGNDNLLYYYNCPRFDQLRKEIYELPKIKEILKPYNSLFKFLSANTGTNITTTENVFFLDNLFQALENVGVSPPKWAQEVMPQIKEITKIEYAIQFYNAEMIRLSAGVLMSEIVNASKNAIAGKEFTKLHLYSAHENNVAAMMAGVRVFVPHQPQYGATFALELRRRRLTGQYGITAVYSPEAGGPGKILPIEGCGGLPLCDFQTFLELTKDVVLSMDEFEQQCQLK